MIEFRLIKNDDGTIFKIQYRIVPAEIGWIGLEDKPVFMPKEPINFSMEKNWTEWMDIPWLSYSAYCEENYEANINDDESLNECK